MTDNQDQTPDVHPVALLLTGYVNGTLSEPERREVETHLAGCADCSDELAGVQALRQQTRTYFDASPGPSAQARQQVLSRLPPRAAKTSIGDRIAQLFHELLAPKWAPAALMLVVVGQFAGFGWLATRSNPVVGPTLVARGVPDGAVRLKIVFDPAASQAAVQNALRELGARIVDGPTADGALIVELTPDLPKAIAAKIRRLRDQPNLVKSLDSAPP